MSKKIRTSMSKFVDDNSALDEIAKGNLKAYRFLFDNYFSDLCNFLLIYLHKKEFAEEVALDIFTFVWEKREHLQINTSFKGFLFAAAKNKAISFYRKNKKNILSGFELDDNFVQDAKTSQKILEEQELHRIIEKAIEQLPEKSRAIYKLAWEENLSYKEIAAKKGIAVKTVENHIGIALRKLRTSLKPYYEQIFVLWMITMKFL